MAGNAGVSEEQMSVRDLKLDTKPEEGGESKEQREKAISRRPKQEEKCAHACNQAQFQRRQERQNS